jgi:hypothetical protein
MRKEWWLEVFGETPNTHTPEACAPHLNRIVAAKRFNSLPLKNNTSLRQSRRVRREMPERPQFVSVPRFRAKIQINRAIKNVVEFRAKVLLRTSILRIIPTLKRFGGASGARIEIIAWRDCGRCLQNA